MNAPMGGLEVETSFNPFQWVFFFCKPAIEVNGHRFDVPWGRQLAPMPAGTHQVKVYVPYLFGPACVAQTHVTVHPGYVTSLAYETAFFVFSSGTLRERGTRPLG
jgi:hypothetical protein